MFPAGFAGKLQAAGNSALRGVPNICRNTKLLMQADNVIIAACFSSFPIHPYRYGNFWDSSQIYF